MGMEVRVVANADKDEVKVCEGLLTVRVKAPARGTTRPI